MPLRAAREFNDLDGTPGHATAIVNWCFADIHFPDTNPVGQHLQLSSDNTTEVTPPMTIVGVAPMVDQAAVGLHALTAHTVAQRSQEIGIRMALGAERRHVRWLVLRRTMTQVALGTVAGLVLSNVLPATVLRWE